VTKAIITEREAELLRELEALRERVITVDDFDPDEVRPNYMSLAITLSLHAASTDRLCHFLGR
jgi:hypothetical protein